MPGKLFYSEEAFNNHDDQSEGVFLVRWPIMVIVAVVQRCCRSCAPESRRCTSVWRFQRHSFPSVDSGIAWHCLKNNLNLCIKPRACLDYHQSWTRENILLRAPTPLCQAPNSAKVQTLRVVLAQLRRRAKYKRFGYETMGSAAKKLKQNFC